MNIIKLLVRQPIKFIFSIFIVSIGVAILCICLVQTSVATKMDDSIEYDFTTIALPTTKYNYEESYGIGFNGELIPYTYLQKTLPKEISDWINNLSKTRQDLVQVIAKPGLASAYIPELKPENMTKHLYYPDNVGTQESQLPHKMEANATYSSAMLEIELREISEPTINIQKGKLEDGTEVSIPYNVVVELRGQILSVVSLQEGYNNPIGLDACLTLILPNEDSLKSMNLTVGDRYLVYGDDYLDGNWALCGYLSQTFTSRLKYPVDLTELDKSNFSYYSEEEQKLHMALNPYGSIPIARYYYKNDKEEDWDNKRGEFEILFESDMKKYNSILMTLKDETLFGNLDYIRYSDDSGFYPIMKWDRYITDKDGNKVQITQEEYSEMYSIPTIAHLQGTVEEFLQSNEGCKWKEKLEQMEINYQSFAVIGIDKLGYIADFARESARIVEGRDFTVDELENGAKVCIVSESLAALNNLKIGDTISPYFYNYDYNDPYQGFISEGDGLVNPTAYKYTSNTNWFGEVEEYIIIGLYTQDNAWCDVSNNLYSFTPNTIFVPKTSVSSDMDYGNLGFFQTLILNNGVIEEFRKIVDDAGYSDLFVFYDQGYTTIYDNLHNYRDFAKEIMIIGITGYILIIILFLLLFPCSQIKTLYIMKTLGTQRKYKIRQILMTSMGALVPGTAIGIIISIITCEMLFNYIAKSIELPIKLEINIFLLLFIALVQFILVVLFSLFIAILTSRNDKTIKRV